MAIKKESLISLLVKLGSTEEDAKSLVESQEEKEYSVPDNTKIHTADQFSRVVENLKNDNIKVGKDLMIKELKEKAGLEFDGKNPEKFIEAFKEAASKEAGTTVDEKVKSRDKTIGELKEALAVEKAGKDEAVKSAEIVKKDFELLKLLPKNRDPRFTDQQYLTLIKSEIEFSEEEGKPVVKKGGNVIKDGEFNPVTYESAIKTHFEQSKWVIAEGNEGGGVSGVGGRGGGNSGGTGAGKFNSLKDFNASLEAQGIHLGSEKATQMLNAAMKANPEMDLKTI